MQGLREGCARGTLYLGPEGTGTQENESTYAKISATKPNITRASQLAV